MEAIVKGFEKYKGVNMKLPWDRNYFKICFYVVATYIMCCVSKKLVDVVAYTLANMGDVFSGFTGIIGTMLSVFSVIFIGFAIAYIFDPVVDYFQNKYCNIFKKKRTKTRTAGTVITYLIIVAVLGIICVIAIKKISSLNDYSDKNVIGNLAVAVQGYVNDLTVLYNNFINMIKEYDLSGAITNVVKNMAGAVISFTQNLGTGTVSAISKVGSGIVDVFISLVVAFYFLKDKEDIKQWLDKLSRVLLKDNKREKLYGALNSFHYIFSGYIRGQLTDGFIMSILIASCLSIIDVRFALIIGIISGFSNVIPYFGAIIGFVLAVAMALVDGELMKAVYAAIIMLVLQQIDTIIIVPKVVGEKVKLSPVLVIISLAVAGNLFGIVGMIFAVPVTAVLKMIVDNYINKRSATH